MRTKATVDDQTNADSADAAPPALNACLARDNAGAVTGRMSYGAAGLTGYNAVQFQFNPLGDVAHSLNAAGAVQTQRLYDAYGNPLQSPVTSDPFGYRGQVGYYTDHEAGYIALAYRYYDPPTGRFLNRDPIGFRGGVNLYGYVGSRPLQRADVLGYQPNREDPNEHVGGQTLPETTPPTNPMDEIQPPEVTGGLMNPDWIGNGDPPTQHDIESYNPCAGISWNLLVTACVLLPCAVDLLWRGIQELNRDVTDYYFVGDTFVGGQ